MSYGSSFLTGGTPSSSLEGPGGGSAAAFDGNPSTFWDCYPATFPEWIKYDLGAGITKTAAQYTITFYDWNYPTAWTFQGSNNGTDWTTLDTQTGQSFTDGEKKTYNSFVNTTAHRYHRWNFTAATGVDMAISELEAMEEIVTTKLYGTINIQSVLNISGTIQKGKAGDIEGSIAIPLSFGATLSTNYISGSITITPSISGTAEYTENYDISSSILIPISISGTLNTPVYYYTDPVYITFPIFTIDAEGYLSSAGIANFEFPPFTLSATGDVSIIGTLEKAFPVFTLSAEGRLDVTGTATITFPLFSLSATALAGVIGTLEKNFPVFTLSGTGTFDNTGTFAKSFPVFKVTGIGLASSYLSMVLNIKNRALTLYDNYDFNSLCRFNDKNFGATKTAIYDLDAGTTDAGTKIDWNMKSGYLDLEQKTKKKLRQAWLSYKSDGDILLTVIQPDGEEYDYILSGVYETETGLKLKFGKGIKSKYVALNIKSVDGSTMTLDVLKLHLEKAGAKR